jgi:uncharacterized membrane protein YtjA (UPF0391 family)
MPWPRRLGSRCLRDAPRFPALIRNASRLETFTGRAGIASEESVGNLLYWAVVFLVVGIIAALFGFGGAAGTAVEGARILFWVAIVLFVVSLIGGFVRGRGV